MGSVFAVAALRKASRPDETLRALAHFVEMTTLPESAIVPLFLSLIGVELLLAAMLFFEIAPRWSARAAAVLIIVFTAWIAYLLMSGTQIGCGCGVRATWLRDADARWVALGRNVVLLVLAWFGARIGPLQAPIEEHTEELPLPA